MKQQIIAFNVVVQKSFRMQCSKAEQIFTNKWIYSVVVIILFVAAWWRVTLLSLTPWKCVTTQNGVFAVVVPKCSKHFCHVDHFTLPPLLVLFYIPVYHLLDNAVEAPWNGHGSIAHSFHYQQHLEANSLCALGSPSWSPSAVRTSLCGPLHASPLTCPLLYPFVSSSRQRCWFPYNGHGSIAHSFHYQQHLGANSPCALALVRLSGSSP